MITRCHRITSSIYLSVAEILDFGQKIDLIRARARSICFLSDYPLRLLRVKVYKESGELLFKRPLWLTAAGKRRLELSLLDIFISYRQRFDFV